MSPRLLALVLVALAVAASAQTPGAPASQPIPPAAPAADTTALEPRGFEYSSDGRRDPFVSLLQRGSDVEHSAPLTRAPGLAGLGTAEVTLKGTVASQGSYVAILKGADTKTYIVHPGEKLMDGTVGAITADAVVILQKVTDSLSLVTPREVRKTLRETEEAK